MDIWRALASWSYRDKKWIWGGRYQANSVSDAQQLLCLLFPAVSLRGFGLSDPDRTDKTVLDELKSLGSASEIPVLMVNVLHEFFDRYTLEDTPVFSGGSYFQSADHATPLTADQQALDVVESYATSLTLMLSTLDFANEYSKVTTRKQMREDIERLRERASKRLTASMVGLLRSFSINPFDADSRQGRALLRTINQDQRPDRHVIQAWRAEMEEVVRSLADVNIGSGQNKDLSGASMMFECGWSWGVVEGTAAIEFASAGKQPDGVAADEPYLYFTAVALDSIADLFTAQSLRTDLLDVDQSRLARALQNRYRTTQLYWATVADFGGGRRWPLEDVPWRATDEIESDYLSILVVGVAMRDLVEKKGQDPDLDRLGTVLTELTNRARITRRPTSGDGAALRLHDPGFEMDLAATGEIEGPPLRWPVQDYAAVLLKRAVRVASLFQNNELQTEMLDLSDDLWRHLQRRHIPHGHARDLWDSPAGAFPSLPEFEDPSWQMTVRIVECLVIAAQLITGDLLASERLRQQAQDMMIEAERLLDRELLTGAAQAGPSVRRSIDFVTANLRRADEILNERPASTIALVNESLLELEKLLAAREGSTA
ncbi:MAG TPA: SCO2524 family protein [Candidatus Limnocylindrales bacterium]|nr:SCO2524 family protein [Candidatus Limnocylindrales bacterium]